jgi:hypothetical protein
MTYDPRKDGKNLVSPYYRRDSLYVTVSKECSEASARVYAMLTADEQAQMQRYMSQSCKMEDGTLNIHDCPLTRKMFAGYYK